MLPSLKKIIRLLAVIFAAAVSHQIAAATDSITFGASTVVTGGNGNFAPTYMSSNRYGTLTQSSNAYEALTLRKSLTHTSRFSYGFGLQAWAGTGSEVGYARYDIQKDKFTDIQRHPAYVWLQELYGTVRYRSLFAELGMRDYDRSLFTTPTSSGDIVLGQNARGIPQLRAGFIDFVSVPLTRSFLQIQGEIAYGKFADKNWLEKHYNYYNSFLTTGAWFHYKRLYLRSNPQHPLSVTFGMQHAAQFGGTQRIYNKGVCTATNKSPMHFKDFFDIFLPRRDGSGSVAGDQAYYNGNHLGSWDLRIRYRLPQGDNVTFYVQAPWEDGSGIGKLNGWDGLWGLSYEKKDTYGWLTGATLEYMDFSNMSGPMHWAPGDFPGTSIPNQATGADDYYNNYFYNGWMNSGMGLGSPLVKSPIYNTDGYMRFTDNRIRGFHIGLQGQPCHDWGWRLLTGWQRSLGTPFLPSLTRRHNFSLMLEASHAFASIRGLSASAAAALDAGSIFGHRYALFFSLNYTLKTPLNRK